MPSPSTINQPGEKPQTVPQESTPSPTNATIAAMRFAILGLLSIFLCLAASLASVLANKVLPAIGNEADIGISFGFGFGVVSLAALWTSLGPFRFFTRAPLALLLTVLSATVMTSFYLIRGSEKGSTDLAVVITLSLAVGLHWVCVATIMLVLRRAFQFRIDLRDASIPRGMKTAQFGIKQMLLWMTGAGVTLGVIRILLGVLPAISGLGDFWRMTTVFGIMLSFNIAVAVPWAWAVLGNKWATLRIAATSVAIVLLTSFEGPVFDFVVETSGDYGFFWWLNGCASLCLVVNLLIVRLCGYRLVREASS